MKNISKKIYYDFKERKKKKWKFNVFSNEIILVL